MTDPIHIISLGAGVQSSTMALMAAHGEITPMPVAAIFADTGDEPAEVYEWLNKLQGLLPFPTRVVSRSRLSEHLFEWGQSQIPAFTKGRGMGKRQCTNHWKVVPVHREIRRFTGTQRKRLKPGTVTLWMGISVDEVSRCKDSRELWLSHRWPLIELGMSRRGCLAWIQKHGYPKPPKSACVYCPYRSPAQWGASRNRGGAEWDLICDVSRRLAERNEYLTTHCLPIQEVDFSTKTEQGEFQFNNECEGMCGV